MVIGYGLLVSDVMNMTKKKAGSIGGKQISLRKRMACEKSLVKARASRARMIPIRKLESKIAMNRLAVSKLSMLNAVDAMIKSEMDDEFLADLAKYSKMIYGEKL